MFERLHVSGRFDVVCTNPDGSVKWCDTIDNLVTTVGKNLALDTYFSGSSYTVTGPYLGLISAAGFNATNVADTMASHTGWVEAGVTNTPLFDDDRQQVTFASAANGAKTLSAPAAFTFTGPGNVMGAFLVFGPSAIATVDDTGGVLYSAGIFPVGKTVGVGDGFSVVYTATL